MKAVLTIPDASPASLGSTSPIAASSSGLKVMPPPMPIRIMPGSTSATKSPSTGACVNQSSPIAKKVNPTTSGGLMPKRMTRRSDRAIDSKPMMSVVGRKASPTSSGL